MMLRLFPTTRVQVLSLTTLLLAATIPIAIVTASPISSEADIVFSPTITSPKASTFWPSGSVHTVTWETKNIPQAKRGSTGMLVLGHFESGNNSENLDIDNPLATSFPIDKGWVNVTIPQHIPCRTDYFVVLFGDSGNRSPKFRNCKP